MNRDITINCFLLSINQTLNRNRTRCWEIENKNYIFIYQIIRMLLDFPQLHVIIIINQQFVSFLNHFILLCCENENVKIYLLKIQNIGYVFFCIFAFWYLVVVSDAHLYIVGCKWTYMCHVFIGGMYSIINTMWYKSKVN